LRYPCPSDALISDRQPHRVLSHQKNREALATANQWCDADDRLNKWIREHPFYSESDQEFQELLQAKIGAYTIWLDTHPYSANEKHHQEYLRFLMEKMRDY